MIYQTQDASLLIGNPLACKLILPGTLVDWPAYLRDRTMITDGQGTICLIDRLTDHLIEGHILVPTALWGKAGRATCVEMLAWIDREVPHSAMIAKTQDRSTRLFLRAMGFTEEGDHQLCGIGYTYFMRIAGSSPCRAGAN